MLNNRLCCRRLHDNLTRFILNASKVMGKVHCQRNNETVTSVPELGAGYFKM
jgi:hypothetical protein